MATEGAEEKKLTRLNSLRVFRSNWNSDARKSILFCIARNLASLGPTGVRESASTADRPWFGVSTISAAACTKSCNSPILRMCPARLDALDGGGEAAAAAAAAAAATTERDEGEEVPVVDERTLGGRGGRDESASPARGELLAVPRELMPPRMRALPAGVCSNRLLERRSVIASSAFIWGVAETGGAAAAWDCPLLLLPA